MKKQAKRLSYQEKCDQAERRFGKIDSMSELIEVAIGDFKKILRRRKYDCNSNYWHEPDEVIEGKCSVCLAGAVMAESLEPYKMPWHFNLSPDQFEEETCVRLNAINRIRCGDYVLAARMMNLPFPTDYKCLKRANHYTFTDNQQARMFLEELEKNVLPAIKKVEREIKEKLKIT